MGDDPLTDIGGTGRQLPVTSHTALATLKDADPAKRDAELERLVQVYWKPVYCLVRRHRAATNEDAKDLTQDFFTEVVLKGTFADRYSPEKGSFRAYLKGALHNFLSKRTRDDRREKRGGHLKITSLQVGEADLEDLVPNDAAIAPEEAFDRAWRTIVLGRAQQLLQARLASQGKGLYYEVFRRYDLESDASTSYDGIARELKISTDDVKNYLTRAREEFRNSVRAVLCESVGRPEDLASEWDALFGSGG